MAPPPDRLPLLIDEALSLLPPGMVRGRAISVAAMGRHHGHPDVLRLRMTGSVDTLCLVVKRVSRLEYETHALLSRELPHVVPHLYVGAPSRAQQDWIVVMQHHRPTCSRASRSIDRTTVQQVLRALAEIHQTYAHSVDRLRLLGLTNAGASAGDLGERLAAALDVLPTLCHLLHISIGADILHRAREAIETLKYHTAAQSGNSRPTLVHGDFHFDNILKAGDASVRITDWGCAAIQSPAWDLVLCSEREIDVYLSAGAVQPPGFYESLRTAVLSRMAEFVVVASGMLLRGVTQVGDTLPLSLERLVEAATAPEFRGGRGVRFSD
jgi:hypothetical protein